MIYLQFELNGTDYFIMPTKIEDVPSMKRIRDQCLEFIHNDTAYTIPQMYEWFLTKNVRYLSIFSGSQENMIGYFRLNNFTKSSCWVGMDLAKEYRGKGIAAATYNVVLGVLNSYGINEFYLSVLQSNQHAVKLYKALGFVNLRASEGVTVRSGKSIGDFTMLKKLDAHDGVLSDDKKMAIQKVINTLNTKKIDAKKL